MKTILENQIEKQIVCILFDRLFDKKITLRLLLLKHLY